MTNRPSMTTASLLTATILSLALAQGWASIHSKDLVIDSLSMDYDDFSSPGDDFSADYDDFSVSYHFSTEGFSNEGFSTEDLSVNDDFSVADDDFITPLEPTERIISCYADCTYPGMTMPPEEWGQEEYCTFYEQSTTCNESSVSSFSCVPSCLSDCSDVFCDTMSALVFTCDASAHGTYEEKTAVESECLDSYATKTPTKTQMTFTALSEFDGVTPSEMDNTESKSAAITAMSLAMSGVTTDDIAITSITGSGGRRLKKLFPKPLTIGARDEAEAVLSIQAISSSSVLYEITVVLEALGYSDTSSSAAYDQLVAQISDSITSGKFQTDLKTAGAMAGVSTFQAASVSKIPTYTAPQLIYVTTSAPTPASSSAPSPFPSQAPARTKKDDGEKTQVGAIVGGVVGGFVFLVAVAFGVYYFMYVKATAPTRPKFLPVNLGRESNENL
jgi:hypothetical protein